MFNEANKKQVLEMQDQFYSDRIGKVYGDFEVTRVWYDWETHKQMTELRVQRYSLFLYLQTFLELFSKKMHFIHYSFIAIKTSMYFRQQFPSPYTISQ